MNKFNWKQSLRNAIPYLALLFGLLSFIYGTFGTFNSTPWKDFWSGLGKTLLAGGFFALIVKTVQLMGIFKQELSDIIYEAKFLENRKDLPEVWENVSKVVFKNKFPLISKRLLKDITEVYFPTKHSVYHENLEHFIAIKYLESNRVEVDYTVNLNVITTSPKEKCMYDFLNIMSFKENSEEVEYTCNYIKVNDIPVKLEQKTSTVDKQLLNAIDIPLEGKEKYKIERNEKKVYNLDDDNIIYFQARKITNNFQVDIQHPEDLKVDFKKCGTISEFHLKRNTTQFKEFRYDGLIYPQQGYIITLTKKHV